MVNPFNAREHSVDAAIDDIRRTYREVCNHFNANSSDELTDEELTHLHEALDSDNVLADAIHATFHYPDRHASIESKWRQLGDITQLLTSESMSNPLRATIDKIRNVYSKATDSIEWQSENPLEILAAFLNERATPDVPIEGRSILTQPVNNPISPNLFANIHGELFIRNSLYEGANSGEALRYVAAYLKGKTQALPEDHPLQRLAQMMERGCEINNAAHLTALCNDQQQLLQRNAEFVQELRRQLSTLAPGQSLLLPSGYIAFSGGHAIYIEAERQQNRKLTIRIYNTGDGIEFHGTVLDNGQRWICPYIEISDVTVDRFTHEKFLQGLLEIRTRSSNSVPAQTNYSAEDLYRLILEGLDGTITITTADASKLIVPQVSGTCTWSGLAAVLHTHLDEKNYWKTKIGIELESFRAYFQTLNLSSATTELHLLKRTAETFSQDAIHAYNKAGIGFEELEVIYATLNDCIQRVEKQQQLNENKAIMPAFEFGGLEQTQAPFGTVPSLDTPFHPTDQTDKYSSSIITPYHDFNGIEEPATFCNKAAQFYDRNIEDLKNGRTEVVLESYNLLFKKLAEIEPWTSVSKEETERIMVMLSRLSDLLFFFRDENHAIILDNYSYYLYALSVELGKQLPELSLLYENADFSSSAYNQSIFADFTTFPLLYQFSSDPNYLNTIFSEPYQRIIQNRAIDMLKPPNNKIPPTATLSFDGDGRCDISLFSNRHGQVPSPLPFSYNDDYSSKTIENETLETRLIHHKLMHDAEFARKLLKQYPKLEKQPMQERIAQALCDYEGTLLSPTHASLRRQFRIIHDRNARKSYDCAVGENQYQFDYNINKEIYTIKNNLTERKLPSDTKKYLNPTFYKMLCLSRAVTRQSGGKYCLSNEGLIWTNGLISNRTGLFIDELVSDQYTEQDIRDLLLLMTRGDINDLKPHKEHQIIKTLSYFTKNLEKLKDPEYQKLFRFLMLEESLLERAYEINPALKHMIIHLIDSGKNHFYENRDIETVAFLIEMGQCFGAIIPGFPSYRTTLVDMIKKGNLTDIEQSLLYQQIISWYAINASTTFTEEDAILFITALTHTNSTPPHAESSQYLKDKIASAKMLLKDSIQQLLQGEGGERICQTVVGTLTYAPPPNLWDCRTTYPRCSSLDGLASLDVESGIFYIKNNPTRTLPQHILNHKSFLKGLCSDNTRCLCMAENTYTFTDHHDSPTEVRWNPQDECVIITQELPGKGRYQYVPQSEVQKSLCKPLHPLTPISPYLFENRTFWIPTDDASSGHVLLRNSDTLEVELMLQFDSPNPQNSPPIEDANALIQSAGLKIGARINMQKLNQALLQPSTDSLPQSVLDFIGRVYPIFINENVFKSKKGEIFSSENNKSIELYDWVNRNRTRIEKLLGLSVNSLSAIYKIDDSSSPLTLVNLLDTSHKLPEEMARSFLWKTAENELALLEMPNYSLTFDIKKAGKIVRASCKEYPGYFLSPNQHVHAFRTDPISLVLENSTGIRKLVVPFGSISPSNVRLSAIDDTFKIQVDKNAQQKIMVFDIDSHNRPVAKTRDQQLYLAHLSLAKRDYLHALTCIRASVSPHFDYDETQWNILQNMRSFLEYTKDFSREGCALMLHIENLLLSQPNDKTGKNKTESMDKLKDRYEFYLVTADTMPQLKLTDEEEIRLIKHLLSNAMNLNTVYIIKRLEHLEQQEKEFNSLHPQEIHPLASPLQRSLSRSDPSRLLHDFQQIREKFSTITKSPSDVLLTSPGSDMQYLLFDYYRMAKAKDPLLPTLLTYYESTDPTAPSIITLLLSVFDYPDQYPGSEHFKEIVLRGSPKQIQSLCKPIKVDTPQAGRIPLSESKQLVGVISKNAPRSPYDIALMPRTDNDSERLLLPVKEFPPLLTSTQQKAYFTSVETRGLQMTSGMLEILSTAISGATEEQLLPAESEKIRAHLKTYWSSPERNKPWHLLDPQSLSKVKTALQIEKTEMDKQLFIEEKALLNAANQLPETLLDALLRQIEKKGSLRRAITINDLYIVTARSALYTTTSMNPELKIQEQELIQKTVDLLAKRAYTHQISRSIALMKEMETLESSSASYGRLSEALFHEINHRPPYKAHKNPEFALFEVMTGLGLRAEQIHDIQLLLSGTSDSSSLILQKVMGSGKTKVYLSLLALMKADGKRIPIVVVPESQYETVAQAMEIQSGQLFQQKADAWNFREDTHKLADLRPIISSMKKTLENRNFLIVTDKMLHNFIVSHKHCWNKFLECKEEEIESYRSILEAFEEIKSLLDGYALLDEADLLYDCRREHIMAVGDSKPIKMEHCEIVADIYASIKEVLKAHHPLTKARYDSFIKGACIDAFIQTVITKRMPSYSPDAIRQYLNGDKKGFDYVNSIASVADRNLLAIALQEFDQLLPITLEKRCGEHFGYSDNPNKMLPVPYVASGVPSKKSDYTFPYTLLNFTLQTLQSDGISATIFSNVIAQMQNRATEELQIDPSLSLEDTQGYRDFQELCDSVLSPPFYKVNASDIQRLKAHYDKNPKATRRFAKKYLFPSITQNEQLLVSTPYSIKGLFDRSFGFTGTPWNQATFPSGTTTIEDPASSGKTIGIIWENSQQIEEIRSSSSSYAENICEIVRLQNRDGGGYNAFIDAGALFVGVENEEVARELLKQLPPTIKGVVFFKDNLPVVAERGKLLYTPYNRCEYPPEQLYIFYDQWHTTGTDLKIGGKSFLSISKNTTRRDLEQAYMRDRQAESGKRVRILCPDDARDYIREDLKLPKDAVITLAHILRHVERNHEQSINEQMIMSLIGKMRHVLDETLNTVLTTKGMDPSQLQQHRDAIKKLLFEMRIDSPAELMGQWRGEHDATEVFTALVNKMVERASPLLAAFPNKVDKSSLKIALWRCVDPSLFPKKIHFVLDTTSGPLAEQQAHQQSQQESQQEATTSPIQQRQASVSQGDYGIPMWSWKETSSPSNHDYYPLDSIDRLNDRSQVIHFPENAIDLTRLGFLSFSEGNPPLFLLNEILSKQPSLKEYSDIFDLEASYNFLLLYKSFTQYYNIRKPATQVLILTDPISKASRVIMLSQSDSSHFYERLKKEQGLGQHELDVTLYDFNLGTIQSNHETPLSDDAKAKIVQAKFYSGITVYSKAEQEILEKWILEKGADRMENLFYGQILPNNSEARTSYRTSTLGRLFRKISRI